jgi:hypothetical protein
MRDDVFKFSGFSFLFRLSVNGVVQFVSTWLLALFFDFGALKINNKMKQKKQGKNLMFYFF